jgi:hypothetical protein
MHELCCACNFTPVSKKEARDQTFSHFGTGVIPVTNVICTTGNCMKEN